MIICQTRRAIVSLTIVVCAMSSMMTGCGARSDRSEDDDASRDATAPHLPSVLVDVGWLAEHLGDPGLVIIDARPREQYAEGHIEGAVNLTPQDLLDPNPANAKNVAPVSRIQEVLGAAGIDTDHTVVVYDGSNFRSAARVFWVLEMHGHRRSAVLNGGLPGWLQAENTVTTEPTQPTPRRMVANVQPQYLATKLIVHRAVELNDAVILDARSPEEYAGLKSRAQRYGHIADAINVDFADNLQVDEQQSTCEIRDLSELAVMYKQMLPEGTDRVITYCNSGNRASVSYLTLRALGYQAAVYDGSWLEWGNDESMPIEVVAANGGDGVGR